MNTDTQSPSTNDEPVSLSDLKDLALTADEETLLILEMKLGLPDSPGVILSPTSDAERKRQKRADERDLSIPRVKEPNRRRDCLADVYLFLSTYFGGVFYQPFTADRRQMLEGILHAARYGGDQGIAGPRSDGKTRCALFGSLYLMLAGHVGFPILISKSGPRAHRELRNLKEAIRDSKLFLADFPEIAVPIKDLGGWSSRARQQTVYGVETHMEWGEQEIILPTVPTDLLRDNGWNGDIESAAREQIVASLGIEGALRGFSIRNRRPDLAILDDIDDRESARSELQTEVRENIIEEDVGGLAGPDKTIPRVMCCTLINRTCIAATFTDPVKKPSWRGQRHKLLLQLPDHQDLWEEYVGLRQSRSANDPDARVAHQFYLDHREQMDAGSEVTNPYRFDSRTLPDGQPSEVSALQSCYNIIADRGWVHFATEYQNDPPEEAGPVESGITPHRIQRQLSGYPRKVIPADCVKLTRGIDCRKVALHWVVRAWRQDGTPFTIDYGVWEVAGTVYGSDEGLDVAIKKSILAFLDAAKESPYYTEQGEILPLQRTLIDASWRTDAVYSACVEAGLGVQPVMGFGKSQGCVQANFSDLQRRTVDRRPGDGWFMSRKFNGRVWLVCADADRWKAWEHDRWMTARDKPGCMTIYGEINPNPEIMSADEKAHHSYARHICNEVEIEEPHQGGMRRRWKAKSDNVHWLDASYYSDVAAGIEGIDLAGFVSSMPKTPSPTHRLTLAQAAGRRAA